MRVAPASLSVAVPLRPVVIDVQTTLLPFTRHPPSKVPGFSVGDLIILGRLETSHADRSKGFRQCHKVPIRPIRRVVSLLWWK